MDSRIILALRMSGTDTGCLCFHLSVYHMNTV